MAAMDPGDLPFSVLNFFDGLQVVPTSWLRENNQCMYPIDYKGSKLTKAISKQEEPQESWELTPFVKLYGKYGKQTLDIFL